MHFFFLILWYNTCKAGGSTHAALEHQVLTKSGQKWKNGKQRCLLVHPGICSLTPSPVRWRTATPSFELKTKAQTFAHWIESSTRFSSKTNVVFRRASRSGIFTHDGVGVFFYDEVFLQQPPERQLRQDLLRRFQRPSALNPFSFSSLTLWCYGHNFWCPSRCVTREPPARS